MMRLASYIALRLVLFTLCIGAGMIGYSFTHRDQTQRITDINQPSFLSSQLSLLEIRLDAEPREIAQANTPVDVAETNEGIYYILQADGLVLRVSLEADGKYKQSVFTNLAEGNTDPSLEYTGLVLSPNFSYPGLPGYGCFYVLTSESPGSAVPDFVPEFGSMIAHHHDVLHEYAAEDISSPEFRGTRRELMRFLLPSAENKVRGLAFDPEGYLYLGVGDGAIAPIGKNSPSQNASSLSSAYGKVLRIDPLGSDSTNGQYGIPESNPFRLVSDALPELWAFGLRAPQSLSYDSFQRGLCIVESANSDRQEINLSHQGGEHFGWDLTENTERLSRAAKARLAEVVTAPTVAINRNSGGVAHAIGSTVYRGEIFPSLAGAIIFGSHDGQILAMRSSGVSSHDITRVALGSFPKQAISALRPSAKGELLLLCENGSLYEIRKPEGLGTGGSPQKALFCAVDFGMGPRG